MLGWSISIASAGIGPMVKVLCKFCKDTHHLYKGKKVQLAPTTSVDHGVILRKLKRSQGQAQHDSWDKVLIESIL